MAYRTPANDIVSIIDAPPTPVASLAPGRRFAALVHYESHPPVAVLARPFLSLGGIRVDPSIAGRQRTRRLTGLSVLSVADGEVRPVRLPEGRSVSVPVWAPDGSRFAFTMDEADGIAVWVADAATAIAAPVPGLRVRDVLGGDPTSAGSTIQWTRDGAWLLALGAPGAASPLAAEPIEPRVEESAGKHSQMATFQDLLRTDADGDVFEELATTLPLRVDPVTGAAAQLGPAGLYYHLSDSPDGQHLLVYRLKRPFSFRVPYPYFARTVEIWSASGDLERVVADLPVSDEVPRQGVPTGPRMVSFEESEPASLVWAEALDGGDPRAKAEHRDHLLRLAAPFDGEPQVAALVEHRCLGWYDMETPGQLMITEHDRDRRWLTTRLTDLSSPEPGRVIFDHSADEAYRDPGAPMVTVRPNGARTVLQDGSHIYLRGDGASPDGDRPFLDRLDLTDLSTERLFRSPADAYEQVLGFLGDDRDSALIWHESRIEPPNLEVLRLSEAGTGAAARRQLTAWPDPHPQLTGMDKRLLSYDRGDGVQLTGMLHLPPGYDADTDGPLPLVVWAYPLDYGDAATAGQVRGTTERFTRLNASDPVWFVLRGFAVLQNATMPVIGDPETMNDSYVEQISAAASAHISALVKMGVADPGRVAVGGHSYGAFMTANLLAHTDLFAAGIARSGAYNRSLTPFGFQTERRNFWEATGVYDRVSPFRYADKISSPLLLIHGARDANSGTFPIQSERLFQAMQGTGGVARLVVLPHESHGYLARESVLHVLAEQFDWLDRWLCDDSGTLGGTGEPRAAAD
ncbi:MAG TPA: prolyl oligopeptidase family serine peptidase [Streptosporangiaceae bacterium]|nr:prolyl oligopeptidase family serine peptidase [Streptosporangiaceae bacterium]HTA04318.1 prolyl oligopeptidase family serine peptidase [Streptosporangiaceae bacterium]